MTDLPVSMCLHYVVSGGWNHDHTRFWILSSCGYYTEAPTPQECIAFLDSHHSDGAES